MSGEIAVRLTPEQEELERKRAELAALETELADRELDLATLRESLAAFEGLYLRTVGALYARLDELNAKSADSRAARTGSEYDHEEAAKARRRAEESRAALESEAAATPEFVSSPELKRLYREVAKKVHPDLTADSKEKARRERMMSDANRAYKQGDTETLQQILNDYESSPESVTGESVGAELVRAIRRITQAKGRIQRIMTDLAEIAASDMARLMEKVGRYRETGRDLLGELAVNLQKEIENAEKRIAATQ